MMIRKVIIGTASLVVAVLLFVGYIRLTGTKGIPVVGPSEITDIPDKPLTDQANRIDKTTIYSANQAVYPIMDPQTHKVLRVFGFDSLLNPGQQSNNWQVRRPYMNVFQKKFCCRLDAEEGFIQMETSGGRPIPRDARLTGSVVVRLFPEQNQRFGETVILLDDLNYSSERSEFFTDGPVELISAQARLVGKGLQMFYNPQTQRIEYFQIKKLDTLRIKNAVGSHILGKSSKSSDSSNVPDSIHQTAAAAADSAPAPVQAAKANEESVPVKSKMLYQCSVRKEVEIRYGKELIVQGADEVNILNILFGSSSVDSTASADSVEKEASGGVSGGQVSDESSPSKSPLDGIGWADRGRLPLTPDDDDNLDVVVLCKGGIVVQPMNGVFKPTEAATMDVRMTGTPMHVLRQNPKQNGQSLPLIQCQSLLYNPSAYTVRLFPGDAAKTVRVFMDTDRNYLETPGEMLWNIKDKNAHINGSGRMVFDSAMQKEPGSPDHSKSQTEVTFGKTMDVFFAESPDTTGGQLFLTAVNLAGGMSAVTRQNGFKTEANSARFEFGKANQLDKARLNGAVRFASDSTSHAQADEAVLTFAGENTLKVADLKGNVAFASTQGQFASNDAKIVFARNEAGQLEAQSLTSTTQSSLISAVSDPNLPPIRFEAKKMDYDLLKGSAFALGPIRFSFNAPVDVNDPGSSMPVVITAQRNAEFLAGPDKKSIQQAIFHGNVVGESIVEKNNEKTVRRFYGDTLTVDLATDAKGKTIVPHVAVTDGDVKLQAIRYLDGVKINHVELHCVRFDYEDAKQTIAAVGPGKIELNNQQISIHTEAAAQKQAMDFRQPCYALVEGFDKLVWRIGEQKLTVDGKKDTLNMSYLTMKDNVPDKLIRAAVSTAELLFGKDQAGKDILSELNAGGGVYVEQKDEHVLKGQTMHYTGNDGWLCIEGSENRPCFADGANVPVINYNLQTEKLNFKLSQNPGAVIIP
jgi:hypothetical protein